MTKSTLFCTMTLLCFSLSSQAQANITFPNPANVWGNAPMINNPNSSAGPSRCYQKDITPASNKIEYSYIYNCPKI